MSRIGVNLVFSFSIAVAAAQIGTASAAQLPEIKTSSSNSVPTCVTPGRLMGYLNSRNSNLLGKFNKIAVAYMRHGEAMKMRWDQAFFQMLVETNSLKFGNDVNASQNNFAGLGATGGGEPGESFQSVSDGVKAHLQHIMMYAGDFIQDPIADRTRKVQSWGILDNWRNNFSSPIKFSDLTTKWSPGDQGYSNDIQTIADRFNNNHCNRKDPNPQWVREAMGGNDFASGDNNARSGRELAQQAIERGRQNGNGDSFALGAQSLASAGQVPFKVLNAPPPVRNKNMKCNVFTASYGGQKAVIIKAIKNGAINFTVLDVNVGKEKAETRAYIAAYAKGGATVAAFSSQSQALDKAFELCPEG